MNKKLMFAFVAFTSMTQMQAMFSGPVRKLTTQATSSSSIFSKTLKVSAATIATGVFARVAYQANKNEFNTQATQHAILEDINTAKNSAKEISAKISDFITKNSGNDTPPTA